MIKFIYLMKQKFFRLLADLRFAIIILLLISFISIIGTIIEQNESIEIYQNHDDVGSAAASMNTKGSIWRKREANQRQLVTSER